MASVKMFCSSCDCDPSTLHIAWWRLAAALCWRSLWRSLLLSCTLVLPTIELYLCQNIQFETSRIQETCYFWFCFPKNNRKTQIGGVNINRLILSQQVVKMFWIAPSPGRWWGGDRPGPVAWRVTVDTATPLAAGVLVCAMTHGDVMNHASHC